MSKDKTIFLLIGPKGSGKTFIGSLFDLHFDIPFVRVEDWVLAVKGNKNIEDKQYVRKVFKTIETGIRRELVKNDLIAFESTGLTEYFDRMYSNLQSDFSVISIGITANSKLCSQRVKTRDQSVHIDVSDDQVLLINEAVRNKALKFDYTIENSYTSESKLLDKINRILINTKNLK
jgi:predicted kinase